MRVMAWLVALLSVILVPMSVEAQSSRDAGGSEADLLRETGVARPFLPRLQLQVRATTAQGLGRLVNELYRADADLKRGRGPRPEELLERLVLS